MPEAISEEMFAQVRRAASRRIAAELVRAMADTDSSLAFIASRIGKSEEQVRKWLYGFIDGHGASLDIMSDLALAMGCEWNVSARQYEAPHPTELPDLFRQTKTAS